MDQKSQRKGPAIFCRSVKNMFVKLRPKTLIQNPAMFFTFLAALLLTALFAGDLAVFHSGSEGGLLAAAILFWAAVLAGNFAQAAAESYGKAQADGLRASKKEVEAHRLKNPEDLEKYENISSSLLKKGEYFFVRAGEQIPADGIVVRGAASVDESAITGESAPVIREAGGERNAVTGGTTLLSDWLVVRVEQEAGFSFLEQMIAMVERKARERTEKEKRTLKKMTAVSGIFALTAGGAYIGLCLAEGRNPAAAAGFAIAAAACLLPAAAGALLSVVSTAGMSRLNRMNVLAAGSREMELAGKADVLLLEKTGIITLGNLQACAFVSVDGHTEQELADAAQIASLADETPEGRSIVVLAKERFGLRARKLSESNLRFIPYSSRTQVSGADYDGGQIRKGLPEAVQNDLNAAGGGFSRECRAEIERISKQGGTPLVVTKNKKVVGIVYLKDIIKDGVKERFADLRKLGIKTIMVTEDSPVTAAAIAAEAGVDDFLAQITPAGKLDVIRKYQKQGHCVAMTGARAEDAPAMAQADIAVAMNNGAPVAKEAGNMLDLDSQPTKLIEIIELGKQQQRTTERLEIFSMAADAGKYLLMLCALLAAFWPAAGFLGLHGPENLALAAAVYNILTIAVLLPACLAGVKYRQIPAKAWKKKNFLLWGAGGFVLSLAVLRLLDYAVSLCGIFV